MTRARTKIAPGGFIELRQGAFVSHAGKACKIRRVLTLDSVVVQYLETQETERVHPTELRPIAEAKEDKKTDVVPESPDAKKPDKRAKRRNLADDEITEEDWDDAKRTYAIIKPLLEMPNRTRADVEKVAKKHKVSAGTIYDWIKYYLEFGHISGLIKGKRGRKRGDHFLDEKQEAVIDQIINDKYLDPQSLTPSDVIDKVMERCEELGIKAPHRNTVINRIADLPLKRRLGERGNKEKAKQLTEPRPGKSPDGKYPLEVVQVDHVQLDIKAVDAETRQTIEARPWLTLAIDCFSRMIVGYFLSFLRPNAFAVGVCLYMGMTKKSDLLATLDLPGRWPVYGKFRKVKFDNAKEFKGKMLERGCDEHHIDLELRPVKVPHYGAYIERMVGNVNKELHKKLGTTHRSPDVSPDYDSSKKAVYTLAELEKEIVDWIVNKHHVSPHSSLSTTPLRKWELGLLGDAKHPGVGLPPMPADPEKLRLDLMPYDMRTVQTYGIKTDHRCYFHEVLRRWTNVADPDNPKEKRKFIVRYDPRTIRTIWFWDPEVKRYYPIPIRDTTWPDISWSEFEERRKAMLKEGYKHVDEPAIKEYTKRAKAREQEAAEKTNLARGGKAKPAPKAAVRKPENAAPGSSLYADIPGKDAGQKSAGKGTPDTGAADDLFDQPVTAFEDIDV